LNNLEKIRAKTQRGERCIGITVSMALPLVSELLGEAGYDFLMIDMEHGSMSLETALGHVQAARGTGTAPFIRVPAPDPVLIKPYLEMHPAGVIVPRINNVEDVKTAVAGCRYPPKGIRGYGPCRGPRFGLVSQVEYLEQVGNQIMVIPQIEHYEAVEQMDQIATTEGVDAIMIGPNDLSGTMGLLGQLDHPKLWAAFEKIVAAGHRANLPVGVGAAFNKERVQRWYDMGMDWLMIGVDWGNLAERSSEVVEHVRALK